jgi:3-isopropylmalate/(R)-2-methylmalate dehydratase small subunit
VELKGIRDKVDEKDELEVDLDHGVIRNITKGEDYPFPAMPPFIMEILKVGGAIPYYKGRIGRT